MSIFKKAEAQDDMDIFARYIDWGNVMGHYKDGKIKLSEDIIRKYSKYFDSDAWLEFYDTGNENIEIPQNFQNDIDEHYEKYWYLKPSIRRKMEGNKANEPAPDTFMDNQQNQQGEQIS